MTSGVRTQPYLRRLGERSMRRLSQLGIYSLATTFALAFMGPFFWTITSSLKDVTELMIFPPKLFPQVPKWENYVFVWTEVPFARWIINSVVVTVLSIVGTVLSSSLVGYSFARFRYPGRDALFLVTLSTMMLPTEVTLIPSYLLFNKFKWIDTFRPLIVPHWFGGGAFNIFLMRQFYMTIPLELDEAARIDGANFLRIYWDILLPLLKPALATIAVLSFVWSWNDFIGPLIYLQSQEKFTLALGVRHFATLWDPQSRPRDHLFMAACTITTTPCILLFFAAQRYFVRGIVMTGIKG